MSYKGYDLDLRPGYPPGGSRSATVNAGVAPIAVDDLVLACCNGAYDVARFHASFEVRLEHLLHALTRLTAAGDVLQALGIGADHLRRETAMAIAAAMPAGSLEGAQAPATSAALEDVLRRSAERASTRRSPASVHDLLRAMLRGGPESPAAMLLMQAAADPQRLARWRDEPTGRATTLSAADQQLQHLAPDAATDLHARLDQLETSLRTFGAEAAADRKIIVESLVVMQRELHAIRSADGQGLPADQVRAISESVRDLQGELQELRAARELALPLRQIAAPDAVLDAKLGGIGQSLAQLAERFAMIDNLAAGDSWQPLLRRVESVEGQLGDQNGKVAKTLAITLSETVSNALSARLDQSEAALQRLRDELERLSSSTGERQIALEASIRAHLQSAEDASKTHERELGEIYEALVKLGTNQQTLGDNLGTWRLENSGDVGIVSNRLQQLERTSLDLLTRLGDGVAALRRDSGEDGPRRSNRFKRWLYGTSSVFGSSWRDEANSIRQAIDRPRGDEKS